MATAKTSKKLNCQTRKKDAANPKREAKQVKARARGTKKHICKALRIKVWENEFGQSYFGKCYCCKTRIDVHNWHCGHLVAEARGGLLKEQNLRPICAMCNLSAGTRNMDEFKKQFHVNDQESRCLIF